MAMRPSLPQDPPTQYGIHRMVLQHVQHRRPRRRWVLKGFHGRRLAALFATYPDARLIWVHRDPVQTLASQITAFGQLNECLAGSIDWDAYAVEQIESSRRNFHAYLEDPLVDDPRIHHVPLPPSSSRPGRDDPRLLRTLRRRRSPPTAEAAMREYLATNRGDRYGRFEYSHRRPARRRGRAARASSPRTASASASTSRRGATDVAYGDGADDEALRAAWHELLRPARGPRATWRSRTPARPTRSSGPTRSATSPRTSARPSTSPSRPRTPATPPSTPSAGRPGSSAATTPTSSTCRRGSTAPRSTASPVTGAPPGSSTSPCRGPAPRRTSTTGPTTPTSTSPSATRRRRTSSATISSPRPTAASSLHIGGPGAGPELAPHHAGVAQALHPPGLRRAGTRSRR